MYYCSMTILCIVKNLRVEYKYFPESYKGITVQRVEIQ